MAKPPKLGKTNLPENELKHKGIKAPKKPQKIRKKKSHKIEEIEQEHIRVRPRYKDYTKKEKEKRERTPEEIAEAKRRRSEAQKEYWRKLKETDPEKYQERINRLHRKTPEVSKVDENVSDIETPQVKDTSDIIETPTGEEIASKIVDLEEQYDTEDAYYSDYGEGQLSFESDDLKDMQNLSDAILEVDKKIWYDEHSNYSYDGEYVPPDFTWEEVVIKNFLSEAYNNPQLIGSETIIQWVDLLKGFFGEEKTAKLIEKMGEDGHKLTVGMLYEHDAVMDLIESVMDSLYDNQYITEFESAEEFQEFKYNMISILNTLANQDTQENYYE